LKPLCFVLMPFGTKPDPAGGFIDFDAVYQSLIKPAVLAAGMDPVRADEEELGGIIHKPMFERLILCDFAVADLTAANANVFYEFGVRHGIRPRTTVSVFAEGTRLPFDVTFLRGVTYGLEGGVPSRPEADSARIAAALSAARQDAPDSPVYQLITDLAPTDISHLNTDVFRDRVDYARDVKQRLLAARESGKAAVDTVRDEIGDIGDAEAGVVVDLLLSYRAVGDWDAMIALVDEMSHPVKRSVLVREQLGLALNRAGRGDEAEQVLRNLIEENGASSETYGLLGRVHKDRWEAALKAGTEFEARGHLKAAIDAYRRGFEADWRDAYPGINAVTLMELAQPPDPVRVELLPVVHYSACRRIAGGTPNYWDHATLLELEVLRNNPDAATDHAQDALAAAEEQWQPETTLRNLRLIQQARQDRNEDTSSMTPIVEALDRKAQELRGPDG
jgi:tetratricopeptide (TPR) repeat protein